MIKPGQETAARLAHLGAGDDKSDAEEYTSAATAGEATATKATACKAARGAIAGGAEAKGELRANRAAGME